MRALVIDRFGGPEELHVADLPTPSPGPGEVLVRMQAVSVNPIDYKMRDGSSGAVKAWSDASFPVVLGRDGTGVIESVGEGVTHVKAGDRVIACNSAGLTLGTYAEFALFDADEVAVIEDHVETNVAAAIGVAGLTAWAAVHEFGKVTNDDIVLIHGAGGGVGQIATQLAVETGAQVYGTASARNADRVEDFGAIHIDYTEVDFRKVTPRPTVIIDGVYFDTFEPSMDHLAEGGRLVVLPSLADLAPAKERGIDAAIVDIDPGAGVLPELAKRLNKDRLDVLVSETFPLEEAAEAHRVVEEGHTRGKIVLTITD